VKILKYDELDSTNNEAKRLVAAARQPEACGEAKLHGTVIITKHQTAGRGRMGRSFVSFGSSSIYASFILPPPENPAEQLITALAAVAVCEAIENTTSYSPGIKWINDILVDGKKVCGILAESVPGAVILGIGVNIDIDTDTDNDPDTDSDSYSYSDFNTDMDLDTDADTDSDLNNDMDPDESKFFNVKTSMSKDNIPEYLRGVAGLLYLDEESRSRFESALIEAVFGCVLSDGGKAAALMDEYRSRSVLLGMPVVLSKGNEERTAIAKDIADDGALIVEYQDGSLETLRTGETSVRLQHIES